MHRMDISSLIHLSLTVTTSPSQSMLLVLHNTHKSYVHTSYCLFRPHWYTSSSLVISFHVSTAFLNLVMVGLFRAFSKTATFYLYLSNFYPNVLKYTDCHPMRHLYSPSSLMIKIVHHWMVRFFVFCLVDEESLSIFSWITASYPLSELSSSSTL